MQNSAIWPLWSIFSNGGHALHKIKNPHRLLKMYYETFMLSFVSINPFIRQQDFLKILAWVHPIMLNSFIPCQILDKSNSFWVTCKILHFDPDGLFLALLAMFFTRSKIPTCRLLKMFYITFIQSFVSIHHVVSEEKIFKVFCLYENRKFTLKDKMIG